MINEKFIIDFKFCDTNKSYSNFFDWYRFTVPVQTRKEWIDEEGIGDYKVLVNIDAIKSHHPEIDDDSVRILEDISKVNSSIEIQHNEGTWNLVERNGQHVSVYGNYIAVFSEYLWNKLCTLFISTFVTQNPSESKEGLKLTFNTNNKTVSIDDIYLDCQSDNPFYFFARKTAMLTSFKSIINKEATGKKKVNYYEGEKATEWKSVQELFEMKRSKIEIKNVIYMLFDCNKNYFYVGKADKMVKRLFEHRDDVEDEMHEFTHFRYTPISDEHAGNIYLIENTAIHDCAAIFNMPRGNHYRNIDMETHVFSGSINSKIIMTNSVENQTK